MLGILYYYRAITMFITVLPKPDESYTCAQKMEDVTPYGEHCVKDQNVHIEIEHDPDDVKVAGHFESVGDKQLLAKDCTRPLIRFLTNFTTKLECLLIHH